MPRSHRAWSTTTAARERLEGFLGKWNEREKFESFRREWVST
jgi:hypothetical protein